MKFNWCFALSVWAMFSMTGYATSIPIQPSTISNHSSPTAATLPPPIETLHTSWTLEHLNQAEWSENLPQGQFPIYAKLQVLLSRKFSSVGAIDGRSGLNTLKAISAYQIISGLKGDGKLDQHTWQNLIQDNTEPAFIEYQITAQDLNQPYVKTIPTDYGEQAKMHRLYYTRVTEMLSEKFHMDELFLQQINPHAKFHQVGEKIIIANVNKTLPQGIHSIIAHKGTRQLLLLNQQNKIIAAFPTTIGSEDNPSPSGTHTIKAITLHPHYSYNPKNFVQGNNLKPLTLPPGPNNPVGSTWIGLSKPSFGIHGTPSPSLISKTASHGCIRLTNWDVETLARYVKIGMVVKFLD